METAHPNRSCLEDTKLCLFQQGHDIRRRHVAVPVTMRENTFLLLRLREVDNERATAALEHATDFADALLPRGARQMMKHQRTQDDIEFRITKRQPLSHGILKRHVRSRPGSLSLGVGNHLRRGIDANDPASATDVSLRGYREAPGPTADIEYVFTFDDVSERDQPVAERARTAVRQQPDDQVVSERPMQDAPGGVW